MTKDELLAVLKKCAEDAPSEESHEQADEALLEYINDPEIREAFEDFTKWYA